MQSNNHKIQRNRADKPVLCIRGKKQLQRGKHHHRRQKQQLQIPLHSKNRKQSLQPYHNHRRHVSHSRHQHHHKLQQRIGCGHSLQRRKHGKHAQNRNHDKHQAIQRLHKHNPLPDHIPIINHLRQKLFIYYHSK